MGSQRVGQDLVTEQQQQPSLVFTVPLSLVGTLRVPPLVASQGLEFLLMVK